MFVKTNYHLKKPQDAASNLFANNKELANRIAVRGSIVLINAPVRLVVEEDRKENQNNRDS